jgi:hypothetical protein
MLERQRHLAAFDRAGDGEHPIAGVETLEAKHPLACPVPVVVKSFVVHRRLDSE